jgi:quercetin dioxygenase-like cupin family protein
MKKRKIEEFYRGWFIGNFEPSVMRTTDFEVGILTHKKGEAWPAHYHKVATEYNVLLDGRMRMGDDILEAGDVFLFEPGDIADPEFLEDCRICVVKVPSTIGDKYEVLPPQK